MDFALVLDIVFLVILLISAVVAFLRGFVREVLTIVGLVGASLVAFGAGPKLTPGMERWLTSGIAAEDLETAKLWGFVPYDIAAAVFTYAGLFVITLIVLSIISHYIAKGVQAMGLGPVDRSLGVVFGILRGLVLIGLLYMPFHILMDKKDKDEWFATSHTFTYVEGTSEILLGFMPESWGRKSAEDSAEDEGLDPLKDLTGENDESSTVPDNMGTDEDAAEDLQNDKSSNGYNDLQRDTIDTLIKNQDAIKEIIKGMPSKDGQ